MNTNGKNDGRIPTTEMIVAQALELGDNMRTLAQQSMDEAKRLSDYAETASGNIADVVNRFSTQTRTLLTFIDKTSESCQVAIQSVNAFAGATKNETRPVTEMKALERAITTGDRR